MNATRNQEFYDLASWVMDRARHAGTSDSRVTVTRRRRIEINYRERRPDVIKEATTQGLILEVFTNKRYASRGTPDFRKSTLEDFISDVISEASIMDEDPYRTLPDPEYYKGRTTRDLQLADPLHYRLTTEERHEMARTVEEACLEEGGGKVISVEARQNDEIYDELILSSKGFEGFNSTTMFTAAAIMTAKDEGDRRPRDFNWIESRYLSDLPSLEEIGRIAAQRTLDLLGAKKIQTETLPVIIENRVVQRVAGGLIGPLSAESIDQQRSFLVGMKGKRLGSSLLTLTDEPYIPRANGSRYYDSDGFPARKRALISEGVVNEFMVDWYYGRKLGWEPTSGSVSNLIIPAGSRSVDEIINDLGRCMLITGFIGGNSNSTTGDFSVGVIGKLFDKSGFVCNVAEMNMAGNHLKFWDRLVETANDQWTYSAARFPSVVIDGVVVAGV
jgi:PmbA protein